MKLTSSYRNLRASLPISRNFMLGVDVGTMPYALRTAFDLLGLTPIKDKLSIDQVVAALQNHEQTLEDQLGRTADDLIRDLNQFLSDQEHVKVSRRASQGDWVVPLDWSDGFTAYVDRHGAELISAFFRLKEPPSPENLIFFRDRYNIFGFGAGHGFWFGEDDRGEFYLDPDESMSEGIIPSYDPRLSAGGKLPSVIDFTPFLTKSEAPEDRPHEMIPEDFYTL